jgi:transporter family protein
MSQWFSYTLIAMLMWGFWGFFSKLATSVLRDTDAYIYELTGTLVVGLVMVFLLRFHPGGKPIGVLYGLLSGIAVGVGSYFFFYAIARGRSAVVVTVTAMYPLVTLLLSQLLLHEPLSLKQALGISLAIGAILLLST